MLAEIRVGVLRMHIPMLSAVMAMVMIILNLKALVVIHISINNGVF